MRNRILALYFRIISSKRANGNRQVVAMEGKMLVMWLATIILVIMAAQIRCQALRRISSVMGH